MFEIKRSKSKSYRVFDHLVNFKDKYVFGKNRKKSFKLSSSDGKRFIIAASTFVITFCASNFFNDSVVVAKNDEIVDNTVSFETSSEMEQQFVDQFQNETFEAIHLEETMGQNTTNLNCGFDILNLDEEPKFSNQFMESNHLEEADLNFDHFQVVDFNEDIFIKNVDFGMLDSFSHNMVHDTCGGYFEEIEKKQSQRDAYEASAAQWICERYGMSASELETFVSSFIQTSQKLETGFYNETSVYDYLYKIAQISNDEKELAVMENLGLTSEQFQTVVNTFIGEAACSYSDGYAVASVGVLRTASDKWVRSNGSSIYHQVVAPSQFVVYYTGDYLNFGGERDSLKYQGVLDALYSQCPLHTYGNFEASFSNRQLFQFVCGGNKYRKELTDLDAGVFQEAATNFVDLPGEIVLAKQCSY